MKEIKDMQAYLGELEIHAEKLEPAQRAQFRNIIRVILSLLVALRKSSNLGGAHRPGSKYL